MSVLSVELMKLYEKASRETKYHHDESRRAQSGTDEDIIGAEENLRLAEAFEEQLAKAIISVKLLELKLRFRLYESEAVDDSMFFRHCVKAMKYGYNVPELIDKIDTIDNFPNAPYGKLMILRDLTSQICEREELQQEMDTMTPENQDLNQESYERIMDVLDQAINDDLVDLDTIIANTISEEEVPF